MAKLIPADGTHGDSFGESVAISGDRAIVGASGQGNGSGAAYLFARTSAGWRQTQELLDPGKPAQDAFGFSVAISGDTAIVGAILDSNNLGAAYVFARTGAGWTQQAKLTAADGVSPDHFGFAVALSGTTAVVTRQNTGQGVSTENGAAYVFAKTSAGWAQQAELTPAGSPPNDLFGWSLAMSKNTIVVGASGADSYVGAAYVFAKTAGGWTQEAKLTATDPTLVSSFGNGVAVAGTTIVVGAPGCGSRTCPGAAYVFTKTVAGWTQQAKLIASHGDTRDYFGAAVATASTPLGPATVIGAPGAQVAYEFTQTTSGWSQTAEFTCAGKSFGVPFGVPVAFDGGSAAQAPTAVAGVWGGVRTGAAYVFTL